MALNFGDKEALASLQLLTQLRAAGVKADLYPSKAKMQKQFKYANNRKVPFVILLGDSELENNSFVVKNMEAGTQETYSLDAVESFLKTL